MKNATKIRRILYLSRILRFIFIRLAARRQFAPTFWCKSLAYLLQYETQLIEQAGSVGGPIANISTGKQFQFWRSVRNLVSSPRRIYFCHKIGVCFSPGTTPSKTKVTIESMVKFWKINCRNGISTLENLGFQQFPHSSFNLQKGCDQVQILREFELYSLRRDNSIKLACETSKRSDCSLLSV